ncbi:MAG: class I SAM-dependent methyltransferase [Nitrososphaerales archaeon]
MDGLKEDWFEVVDALGKIIPSYNLMNRIISLGQDIRLRKYGIGRALKPKDFVLDAGCGPGTMSEILRSMIKWEGDLVLMDSLRTMLKVSKEKFKKELSINAIFEYLPFMNETFDLVMCGFSFRDSLDMDSTLKEIQRILKPKGRFLLVDLGKPDNTILRFFAGVYLRYFVPFMAFLILGKKGFIYSSLYKTYKRYPTKKELRRILQKYFHPIFFLEKMLGGAIVALYEKV